MAAETAPQWQLVLYSGDRVIDVPLTSRIQQTIGGVEGHGISRRVLQVGKNVLERGAGREPRRVYSGGKISSGEHVGGQKCVPFLIVVHELRGILQVPVLRNVQGNIGGIPGGLGLQPVVQRELKGASARQGNPDVQSFRRVHGAVVAEALHVLGISG